MLLSRSQQEAASLIGSPRVFPVPGISLVLHSPFDSVGIVLTAMLSVPLALVGSMVAGVPFIGTFSVTTLAGVAWCKGGRHAGFP